MTGEKRNAKGAAELAEMYPEPKELTVRVNTAEPEQKPQYVKQAVTIDEFDITQVGQVAAIMREIGADTKLFASDNVLSFVLAIAADHDQEFVRAVAIAVRRPPEEVARFAASSFIETIIAIYETNRDFFARSLGNRVGDFMAMVTRLTTTVPSPNGAGNTPSPSFDGTAESSTPSVSH